MKITVHTDKGTFEGIGENVTPEQISRVKKALGELASSGTHLTFDTDTGFVVIPGEVLKRAVIVVS